MLIIGLTGSIATGKSTVSTLLSSPPYSLPVIDADVLARRVVEPGTPGYTSILAHFSPTTPDLLLPASASECHDRHDGPASLGRPLNRPALGRRVFGDGAQSKRDRAALNGIVHPAVRREMFKALMRAYLRGSWAVVLDVPLLYESGMEWMCGAVVVVAVRDARVQMERLRERDEHLSEGEAAGRVASQVDVRVKAERCLRRGEGRGLVLWNDKGKEELREQVARAMRGLEKKSPKWWAWVLLACPPLAGVMTVVSFVRGWWVEQAWKKEKGMEKAKL